MSDSWKDRWNQRFSEEGYAYGTEPNEYLKSTLQSIPKGSILFPAEGEGRNAVYAAKMGWDVAAFDISEEGQKKAMQLAAQQQVEIQYEVGSLENLSFTTHLFDVIALVYAHFPAAIRADLHKQILTLLRPGGYILFEAFSKRNLEYVERNEAVGGPRELPLLFSVDEIKTEFAGVDFIELLETEVELNEGKYHNGIGSVIRFVGIKS